MKYKPFEKVKRSKKGLVLLTLIAVAFAIGVLAFLIASFSFGPVYPTNYIGEIQQELLLASNNAELALTFVDQSAKFAATQSVYDIGKKGGFNSDPTCGTYRGFSVWYDEENKWGCFSSETVEKELIEEIETNFASHIFVYQVENLLIPSNYDLTLSQEGGVLNVLGETAEGLTVIIPGQEEFIPNLATEGLRTYNKIGLEWSVPINPKYMPKRNGKPKWDPFNHPRYENYNKELYYKDSSGNPYRYKGIHRGADIYASKNGVPVMAIADGTLFKVTSCTYILHKGKGKFEKEEYTSAYCHVKGNRGLIGSEVKRGQVIAHVDYPEIPHLHLEMYSKRVDSASQSSKFKICGCNSESSCEQIRKAGCYIKDDPGDDNDKFLINPMEIISYN